MLIVLHGVIHVLHNYMSITEQSRTARESLIATLVGSDNDLKCMFVHVLHVRMRPPREQEVDHDHALSAAK